jgi:hypothetical protein
MKNSVHTLDLEHEDFPALLRAAGETETTQENISKIGFSWNGVVWIMTAWSLVGGYQHVALLPLARQRKFLFTPAVRRKQHVPHLYETTQRPALLHEHGAPSFSHLKQYTNLHGVIIHCQTSRLQHFLDSRFIDCGEVVSLTSRPPFTQTKDSWYSFLLVAESTPGI